jgi:hypothetical protein
MRKFLLKVEDTFYIQGRGLILAPTLPLSLKLPKQAILELKKPDATAIKVSANFTVPFLHFTDPEQIDKHQPSYICIVKSVDKESVPIGTEVWLEKIKSDY